MNEKIFGFVLKGHPVTKKNSGRIVKMKCANGSFRHIVLPSKQYVEYEKNCRKALSILRNTTELPHYEMPVSMRCVYYLKNMAHFPDVLGLAQATADIISDEYTTESYLNFETQKMARRKKLKQQWILSDDRIIKNFDGTYIGGIDSLNPRVEILITPLKTSLKTEVDPYIIKKLKERMTTNLFELGG